VNIGVLASHEGTTLQSVLDACAEGRIAGRITLVVSNNSASGALRRARQAGVSVAHLSSTTHPDLRALDLAIRNALRTAAVDLVLLAGYMKTLGPMTIEAFKGRILNTHPALLPKFGGQGMYGDRVFEAVIEAGAVRFRPIALTAAAVVIGGLVMVLDPIFQGLAVALMSGAVVATLLTMIVVPILYWELRSRDARSNGVGSKLRAHPASAANISDQESDNV